MDAGMTTVGFETVKKAVESGAAPIDLTAAQIIDVMDHLFACEVRLHFKQPCKLCTVFATLPP